MSRTEIYPWKMLVEVGDYFVVPAEFKPPGYITTLVAQKNYGRKGIMKYMSCATTAGTIVMVAEVGSEVPPYEFKTPEGILCLTARAVGVAAVTDLTSLGERPKVAKRTQAQKVAMMSLDQKMANLPWWHDPRTGQLVWNSQVAVSQDTDKWVDKTFNPGPDEPYPEYYDLDLNMQRRTPLEKDFEEEDEDLWAGMSAEGEGDGGGS